MAEAGRAAAAAWGAATGLFTSSLPVKATRSEEERSKVVVIRHQALVENTTKPAPDLVRDLLDEAACALTGIERPADAWACWFKPRDRVGIKVNCLGLPTSPAVGESLAGAITSAGLAPEQIIIWDRSDRELEGAGYRLRKSGSNVRCFGTDTLKARGMAGYDAQIAVSGKIGSQYSLIITDRTDALVSAAVLKDHNLAGLSCTLKNFYGAIHNPNKYHDNGCDPFIADVCAHAHIRNRLRLAVCDAIRPQFNGGPPARRNWQWSYGGILLSEDAVALDRVALAILEKKRKTEGMKPLESENRPASYLASAAVRGLGRAELSDIEVISLGKPWLDS